MTRIITLLVSVALASSLAACGGDDNSKRPGSPAVYDRIDSTSDCTKLQREFDTAMRNHDRVPKGGEQRVTSLAYAQAAQTRIEAVKCP